MYLCGKNLSYPHKNICYTRYSLHEIHRKMSRLPVFSFHYFCFFYRGGRQAELISPSPRLPEILLLCRRALPIHKYVNWRLVHTPEPLNRGLGAKHLQQQLHQHQQQLIYLIKTARHSTAEEFISTKNWYKNWKGEGMTT